MFENEKIVETKKCKHCFSEFYITDKDLEFYEKVSPVFLEDKKSCHSVLPNTGESESLENKNFNSKKDPDPDLRTGGHGNLIKDLGNGKVKYIIPPPSLCPECREQRRISFANVRNLYKRKCDAIGESIISMYSPDKKYSVYNQDFWWSDKWDALDYAREFDFNRSFFEQLEELIKAVPKISLSTEVLENSPYVNYSGRIKNCHLVFLSGYDEDCYYSHGLRYSKNSLDCLYSQYLENCYFVSDSLRCYNCFYLNNSHDCQFCFYSENITNCKYCLFSSHLVGKEYYLFNEKISKEIYEETLEKIKNDESFFDICKKRFKELHKNTPQKSHKNIGSENVVGDFIVNSQNIFHGFDISSCKDSKYVSWLFESKNCYDVYDWGETAENCLDCYKIGKGVSKTCFSAFCLENISDCYYCYDCVNNCSHCFACVGLKNKSYCIFNKQYSKEEYNKFVPKIIEHIQKTGEWGEFFPASISPFGYNETVAYEYYPINPPVFIDIPLNKGDSQSGVEAGGFYYIDRDGNAYNNLKEAGKRPVFKWSDYEAPFPKVAKIIPASKLPDDISEIPDDILNWAIECEITKKPFKIIPQELEFYRKHNLPIPKKHPDERHKQRMKKRNPRKLFERNCNKCGKEIQTTYAPERPEIVYCQTCYEKEIY